MTAIADDTNKVLGALKNSSKGKLVYDRHWDAEGRTQVVWMTSFLNIISDLTFCFRK